MELHLFGSEAFVAGKGLFEDVVVDIGGVLRGRVGRRIEIVAQGQAGGVVHRHALDVGQEALEGHVAGAGEFGLEGGVAERGELTSVAEHPERRGALLVVGHDLVARKSRLFAGLVEVDAGYVEMNVVGIAEGLAECLTIERGLGLVVVIVLDPLVEVGDDVLQVLHSVVTGLDGIVAERLFDGRGVAYGRGLLESVAIEGIAGVRLDEFAELLVLGHVIALEFGESAVGPVDHVVVVDAEGGGIEIGHGVSGLCDVVVARIVHDGGRGAVDIGEGLGAQGVDGIGEGGRHVVHETEGVADFVGNDVLERLAHGFVGHLLVADAGVDLRGLDEAPAIEHRGYTAVDVDRTVDDFARARIAPRGAHGVFDGRGHVAKTRVFEVVGVELRIFFRRGIVATFDHVFETDALEGFVPAEHADADGLFPQIGEAGIDIIDDGLLGFHQLAGHIGGGVGGFDTPTTHESGVFDALIVVENVFAGEEQTDAGIGKTRHHGAFGQGHEGVVHTHGDGIVGRYFAALAHDVGAVAALDEDAGVGFEALQRLDEREVVLQRGVDRESVHVIADDGEELVVFEEEGGGIDEHRGTVLAPPLDGEGGEGEVGIVVLGTALHGGVGGGNEEVGVDEIHDHHAVFAHEAEVNGVTIAETYGAEAGIGDRGEGDAEEKILAEGGFGQLEVEFAVGLVESEQGAGGAGDGLVGENFLIARLLRGLFLGLFLM